MAGGEIRLPSDTSNHAREYAVYGGFAFQARNLTIGVNAQVRKIFLPTATVDNQVFVRDTMELLEIPLVVKYSFGTSKRAWVEAKGAPEFTPRFRSGGSLLILPNPNFDHGYFVRGTAGYNFRQMVCQGVLRDPLLQIRRERRKPPRPLQLADQCDLRRRGFLFLRRKLRIGTTSGLPNFNPSN